MPTYNVDLTNDRGQFQRIPFTLDDDRPLGDQLRQVLEELRQRGNILKGGPLDELNVVWNGRVLDGAKTLVDLRVTPHYSLELSMRRRQTPTPKQVRTEPPATPFLIRGSYLAGIAGFTGAALAWVLSATAFADLPAFLPSYGQLDLAVAGLLGGLAGALITGFEFRGGSRPLALGVIAGLFAGGLGAIVGCLLGGLLGGPLGMATSGSGFRLTRVAAWTLMGLFSGIGIGAIAVARDPRRILDTAIAGGAAGLVGGALVLLPGPTDLWQMLGFVVVGTSLGYGAVGLGLRRALGVIELEQVSARPVGLLGYRWWPVRDNLATAVANRFTIQARSGQCQVVPGGSGAPTVAGKPAPGATLVLNQDLVAVAETQFRFRRIPGAGL